MIRLDLRTLLPDLTRAGPLTDDATRLVHAGQRALMAGAPVPRDRLAGLTGLSSAAIDAVVETTPGLARFDGWNRLVGVFGLSVQPTAFRIAAGEAAAFAWCAWDTLFIPRVLGVPLDVAACCPVTGTPVTVRVSPDGVEAADPAQLLVSFLVSPRHAGACGVSGACCPDIHFLVGDGSAQRWRSSQPAGLILGLEEAWQLGRLYVAAMMPMPAATVATGGSGSP